MFSVPLTLILRDAMSFYLLEGFQQNSPFVMCAGIAENVFKVKGHRSRSCVYNCVNVKAAKTYISAA